MGDPDLGRNTGHHDESAESTEPAEPAESAEPADGSALPFPARLRRLRARRGLSLADLARRTHYSKGYLSKIETGAKPPTVDVARRCDEVLGAGGELLRRVRDTEVPGPRSAAGPAAGTAAGSAAPAQPPPSPPQSAGDCPYRGLAAFTPQDAGWFFGRVRATAALVERVFERIGSGPLMLVAGSGAGKSSLLSAGLVPAL
ncbi:helix-turn-helix domain-containing protein, partial [Streptomyces goshikiensis]